jgi:alkanesulfonate monooxygenase SsuD/methylene tetrahydromethanopterin reductase-like flavin-dependent oxidoreductase (luciferase family)
MSEVGIAPPPLQKPHPPLYGGFTASLRTVLFWAKYGGKSVVLAENFDFCDSLWRAYREEAPKFGHPIPHGDAAGWGGIVMCADNETSGIQYTGEVVWI